jgi:hypothetical protein
MKAGCRKTMLKYLIRFFSYLIVFNGGLFSTLQKIDVDYTEYLGEGYKENYRAVSKVPTMISNHSSWLDGTLIMKYYGVAFALAAKFKHMPLFGSLT